MDEEAIIKIVRTVVYGVVSLILGIVLVATIHATITNDSNNALQAQQSGLICSSVPAAQRGQCVKEKSISNIAVACEAGESGVTGNSGPGSSVVSLGELETDYQNACEAGIEHALGMSSHG